LKARGDEGTEGTGIAVGAGHEHREGDAGGRAGPDVGQQKNQHSHTGDDGGSGNVDGTRLTWIAWVAWIAWYVARLAESTWVGRQLGPGLR